jgi:hypothetical protein
MATKTSPAPARPTGERQLDDLALLDAMSATERLRLARSARMTRAQRAIWVANFPEEVPLINGELEWIALGLADLD